MKTQPSNVRTAERGQETKPCYLYYFNHQGTKVYFTSYDQPVVVNSGPGAKMTDPQTFQAVQVEHSRPEQSFELNPVRIDVAVSATDTNLRQWFLTSPAKTIDVEVWRVNSASMPGPLVYANDLFMEFKGEVETVGFSDYIIRAGCVSKTQREDIAIPRLLYQKTCNQQLYKIGTGLCGVDKSYYLLSATIQALSRTDRMVQISNTTASIGNPPRSVSITADFYEGGLLIDSSGNNISIISSTITPTKLYLQWWPYTMTVGAAISVYPGCNRTLDICHTRFQNLPNFLGTPFIPTNNPAVDGISV